MKSEIIERVNRFFNAVDSRDWELCESLMADRILADYTSMAGGEPAELEKGALTASWKGLLPGFDSTHHQLGNAVVDLKGEKEARYFSYVTATHHIAGEDGEVWTVAGSYDIELKKEAGGWVLSALKLNFKYQDGNGSLPAVAQGRCS